MTSRSAGADGERARLANLVGAWTLGVADRVRDATTPMAGRGGQAAAALVALHEFGNGRPIEQLRSALGLSHSATVRLVDALEADGLVARRDSAGDRRAVGVTLTPSGRQHAERIAGARHRAIAETLETLSEAERRTLARLMNRLMGDLTALRLRERNTGVPPGHGWLCRLCDFDACGRNAGRCPAATAVIAASRREPRG